jgi:hypothetical protein
MAEHEHKRDEDHQVDTEHAVARFERTERSLISRLTHEIRFVDFMGILMVAATAFSAFATWRTAQVTNLVFATADRPFLGVQQVRIEGGGSSNPTIAVDFRNFGQIPALNSMVSVHSLVDGKLVKEPHDDMSAIDAGIVSPTVPHFFYSYLPADKYQSIVTGQSTLQVHVRMVYKGPEQQHQYCYFERVVYDYRSAAFRLAGGDDRCDGGIY